MERTRSLKLLEMPFLRQKLGFRNTFSEERVIGMKEFGYSGKVLVGNWLEERAKGCVCSDIDLLTTYEEAYKRTLPISDTQSFRKYQAQGQGSIDLSQGVEDEDKNNFTTVYDLAYRCKVRDPLAGNHGNMTNYGRKECKQKQWTSQKCETSIQNQYHTEYFDSFSFYKCPAHITN